MKKRVISLFICAAMMTALCGCGDKAETVPEPVLPDNGRVNPIEESKPEWEYTEEDGSVTVEAYNGKDAVVTVPAEIDGKPVKRLGYLFKIENDTSTKLELPAGLEYIPNGLGENITEIVVEEGGENFYSMDGMVFSKGYRYDMLSVCPQGKTGGITVPEGIGGIENFAFLDCSKITAVKIPESVLYIDGCAFTDCTALTSVNIPKEAAIIKSGTFSGCTSLETLDIPETVTDIGAHAFEGTPFLQKLIEKDPFVVINGILVDGTTLKGEVTIPDNIKKIAGSAFEPDYGKNTELKKVILHKGFTEVDYLAFENCAVLEEVILPKSIERIGGHAFDSCESLKSIKLPDGLKEIGMYAFNSCTGLTSADIPNGVTEIDMCAFRNCENLEHVSVPDSVVEIGLNNCFENCAKINVTFKGKTYTAANIEEFYKAVEENKEKQKQ